MSGNSIGKLLKLTTFGESHGKIIGGVLDGFPPGVEIDFALIERDMKRRRPGQSEISTPRNEADVVEIVSGINNGVSTGCPISFFIRNNDIRPQDYNSVREVFRPSHADYTNFIKYGKHGITGGGRSSARETATRVAAGAIAKCFLLKYGVSVQAFTSGVGNIDIDKDYTKYNLEETEQNIVRCPDISLAKEMEQLIIQAKQDGDSLGGRVSCLVKGLMPGIGEPVFDKLQSLLAAAIMSIPSVNGFEYGSGFEGSYMKGSNHNDVFQADAKGKISTLTNFSGGIQGGISNGNDIYFRVAFKPVPSIFKTQKSVDTKGQNIEFKLQGRHDSCVVPRAVPVIEAMTALVLSDLILLETKNKSL
ncbi:MAG: chorismate synthase [Bacteroidetes bacterium]|nr:chorismate synthase [Bacteroidota bacterium]